MLREFKVYDWISEINEFCTNITESMNESSIILALESTSHTLKSQNKFNSYTGAISIIEGLIADEDTNSDKIISALTESTWIPAVKGLFSIVETKSALPITSNPNVTISKVYSPVDVITESDSESYLFALDGKLYEMDNDTIKISDKRQSRQFDKLLQVCERFDIVDNKLKMNHRKHTIEISLDETKEFIFDGRKIEESHIQSTLAATGSFYINDMGKLDLIEFAAKHADKIQEMDFVTNIKSNTHTGVTSNIIRLEENVFVNNINRSMMENTLVKSESGNNAVALIKEFVNYDASNIIKDILEGEEKFNQEISESKTLIEERLEFLNDQLADVIEAEKTIGSSIELKEAKDIIKESLDTETDNLATLLRK
jgi:hypothetical protein